MSLFRLLKPVRLAAGLALVLAASSFSSAQAAIIVNWTGDCFGGCGGGGASAVITLVDTYVPGDALLPSDILQFDFSSNALSITMVPPLSDVQGSLPSSPGASFFAVADGSYQFFTLPNGVWEIGTLDGNGYTTQAWGDNSNFATATPEPGSVLLIGAGLAAVGTLRRRKK